MADLKQQLDVQVKALMERVGLGDMNPVVLYVALAVILFILFSRKGDGGSTTSRNRSKKSSKPKKNESAVDVIDAAAQNMGVTVVEVTRDTAKSVHKELRSGGVLSSLVENRLRTTFVNDFLSCVAGTYLTGSSKLGRKAPSNDEYDIKNGNANFAWRGLRIFVLRQNGTIKGMCVLHDAYLSSYPGPDASHHDFDPVVKLSPKGKDVSIQIGNDGSRKWTDIPIVCGRGYGRLCLAVALNNAKASSSNFLINIAGGDSNRKMVSMLEDFDFARLHMQHPSTKEDWQDEEGEPLLLMYRGGRLSGKDARAALLGSTSTTKGKRRASSKKRR